MVVALRGFRTRKGILEENLAKEQEDAQRINESDCGVVLSPSFRIEAKDQVLTSTMARR